MRFTIAQALGWSAATVVLLFVASTAACAQVSPSKADAARTQADPFARRAWNLELGGHGALETWNYNGSHEELWGLRAGFTYGLGNGMTFIVGWPLYYVSQRGVDGFVFGPTFGLRGKIYERGRFRVFLEFEVGVSEADTSVPPRGTRFNYLALGGAGTTIELVRGVHFLTGLKWIHVSNNGLAGRHRNPDIEAVGPHASVLVRF
jgi:opacity protein-like surface antigen